MKSESLNISINTIAHKNQRYETIGDYFVDNQGDLKILISDLRNFKMQALVAVHELIEFILVLDRRIPLNCIDDFDKNFEEERAMGQHNDEEPGDDPAAPYKREHFFATNIERLLARELGIDWTEYQRILNNTYDPIHHKKFKKGNRKTKK